MATTYSYTYLHTLSRPDALPIFRGARAFDRHRRRGEQCTAAAKTAHQTVGIGRKIVSIVGRYAVRAERSGEPWDRVPVELEPRTDDERAIAEHAPIGERHPVARGIEGCRRAADPFGACWDQPRFVAPSSAGPPS